MRGPCWAGRRDDHSCVEGWSLGKWRSPSPKVCGTSDTLESVKRWEHRKRLIAALDSMNAIKTFELLITEGSNYHI